MDQSQKNRDYLNRLMNSHDASEANKYLDTLGIVRMLDDFATAALTGFTANPKHSESSPEELANACYGIAVQLIMARNAVSIEAVTKFLENDGADQ